MSDFMTVWRQRWYNSSLEFGIHKKGWLGFSFFSIDYDIYSSTRWALTREEFNKLKEWANGYDNQELILTVGGCTYCGFKEKTESKCYLRFYQDRVKRFGRDDHPSHNFGLYLDSTEHPHNIPKGKSLEEIYEDTDIEIRGIVELEIPFNGASEYAKEADGTLEELRLCIDAIEAFNLDYYAD